MTNPFLTQKIIGKASKGLTLSSNALRRCQQLLAKEGKDAVLRVKVVGGGCSGFQYVFDIDTKVEKEDFVVKEGAVCLVCDRQSLDYIDGSVVDFVESLRGSHFTLQNPNTTANCGCGTSFSI